MAGNMLLLQNTDDVLHPRAESRNALKYTTRLLPDTVMLNVCYLGLQHRTQQLQFSTFFVVVFLIERS